MTKFITIVFALLCLSTGTTLAQTCGPFPNTLTNGTTADATQVMANLNLLLTCVNQKIGVSTAGLRNRIMDGNFAINQRGYSSGSAITASIYAHDRWKAGASGATYTFSQTKPDTTITITAGTMVQVVEDVNVEGGTYTLSWAGSAQARVATGGGTPTGAFSASPLAISSAAAGQAITVEFNTGTLGLVQLEPSTTATVFERRPLGLELALCQRYYERLNYAAFDYLGVATVGTTPSPPNGQAVTMPWKVVKRAVPSVSSSAASSFVVAGTTASSVSVGGNANQAWGSFQASSGNTGANWTSVPIQAATAAWVDGSSEL